MFNLRLSFCVGLFCLGCASDGSKARGNDAGSAGAGGTAGSGGSSAGTGGTSGGTGGSGVGGGLAEGGSGGSAGSGGSGGTPGPLALTSTAFENDGTFPLENTCQGNINDSPEFAWSGGPVAQSYSIAFTDTDNTLIHWVIWDIPGDTLSLMAALPDTTPLTTPDGAQQASFSGTGYAGPCPGGEEHVYEFVLYALDVATLPDVTTSSEREAIVAAMEAHMLEKSTLSGKSSAMN
jgi:Raf kinase inhibitor-like YbhB/YbcL family protein